MSRPKFTVRIQMTGRHIMISYAWIWMHKTEDWHKMKLPLKVLTNVLDDYDNVPGIRAWFTSNHDENSWNGSEYEKYGDAAKALAVHSCTWQGIPLVYSGQELPNKKRLKFFDKDVIEWKKNCELHGRAPPVPGTCCGCE